MEADEVCANCGKAAVDNVKLKKCGGCELVKYCSVECQKIHRPKHKKECKKRAAEIRYDKLFRQPAGSHMGECAICCLPMPLDPQKSMLMDCCSKLICLGCNFANRLREREQGLEIKCAFCREPLPELQEEADQNFMNRVKANDPAALNERGKQCYIEGNYEEAFKYFTKAAALDHIDAHYKVSCFYLMGHGVEKDKEKEIYHAEEAAIGGHPKARFNLGCVEMRNKRFDRAMKHYIIAARLGDDAALEEVKKGFQRGWVSKDDYAAALRGHQAAVDATKSQQREEAYKKEFHRRN
jgi:TPR repeat protein